MHHESVGAGPAALLDAGALVAFGFALGGSPGQREHIEVEFTRLAMLLGEGGLREEEQRQRGKRAAQRRHGRAARQFGA